MRPRSALLSLLALVAWGCASAEGAYRDGMDREVAGDYAAAADAYVRALERDRGLNNVAGRLGVAGREAVRQWLATAQAGSPVSSADAYLAADALCRRAAAVGVTLDRPASFAADLDAALDAAVLALTDDAARRLDAADYAGAVGALSRARGYRPRAERRAAMDDLAREAYAGWAEADLAAGRFRAAYAHVEAAFGVGPTHAAEADRLAGLQAAILDAGTVVAAVFPAESVVDDLPRGFLRDVDDVLVDDRLATLPPFLALVDPAEVRRLLRRPRRRGADLIDNPRRVADLTRDLAADLGVAVEVGPVLETETAGEPREERVRLRRSTTETTFLRRRVTLRLATDGAVTVVDAASGRVVCEEEVRESVTEDYDVATYSGDWRDLDLDRRQRALFAEDAADRALDRLRDATAEALAGRVVRCLDRQVP